MNAMPNSPEIAPLPQGSQPRENFPVTVFQHLEHRIRGLRTDVMKRAVLLARNEAVPGAQIYTVTEEHVDRALREVVEEKPLLLKELLKVA